MESASDRPELAALGAVVAIAGAVFFAFWLRGHKAADPAPALAKSIAVLPFENISEDKGNAYLADGIQDEIRTRLAKIADLKVISRTSTQNYKSKPGNLSEIAKQLGVANILEGSVQKSGEAVHITVQLISARDDSHLWAESYDRELRNIFSVEREVAETVATQLKAKLVPQEVTELARLPTTNPQVYDLYLRARYINQQFLNGQVDSSLAAVDFCRQAIALDPGFALAYALLARTELIIYLVGEDRSLERIANARANAEKSSALQPDLIEGHLARASIYTYVKHDYANALVEYESLLKRSPNDSELNANMAFANGRAGNWQAKLTGMLRACELDPRNSRYLRWMASTYAQLRRYPEAEQAYEKALALTPDDWFTRANSAWNLILQGKLGDAREALKAWPDIKLTETALSMKYSHLQWIETLSRNYDAALANGLKIPVLGNRFPTVGISVGDIKKNTDNGFDALYKGDATGAHQAFTAARDGLESQRAGQLDDPQFYNAEALVAAGMDNREAAVNAARKALALAPIESDAYYGTDSLLRLAQVYAHFGEADQAVPLIRKLLDVPGTGETITPALLRLDPIWDPLRNDPRFQALLKDYPAEGGEKLSPEKSIAVLPFENRSADQANAYFADGIQDEILTRLAKIGDLKVISRTSTEKYRGRPINLKTVGEELGVTALLEGSVQKSGGKVRVTVQLIEARSDHPLWAESYDRSLEDIFTVQSEIAGQVASALYARLTPQESVALKSVPTRNQKAYDLFLRGEHFLRTGLANFRAPDVLTATEFYRQAVTEDAQFALAYAQLSFAESFLYWVGADPPGDPPAQAARVHADKAAALAPDLLEAHLSLAYCDFWGRLDYPSALEHLTRARALAPQSADVLAAFGLVYGRQLRFDDAIAAYQRAVQYDPGNSKLIDNLAYTYWSAGRFEMVPPTCERALVVDPDNQGTVRRLARLHVVRYGDVERARRMLQAPDPRNKVLLAFISSLTRDYETAIRLIEQLPADSPAFAPADESKDELLGLYCFRAGQVDRARPLLESVRNRRRALLADKTLSSRRVSYNSIRLARLEATLGNGDAAVEIAERGAEVDAITRDRLQGTAYRNDLAEIYARTGRNDKAIALLAQQLKGPPVALDVTPVMLRLDPRWDSLRQDPRFQALLKEYPPEGGQNVGKR